MSRKRAREDAASQHFHPLVHAVSEFLLFRDCASMSSTSKLFYSLVWVHVLTSCSRPLKLNNRIDVRPDSVRWITKYSKSLQNQTLILGIHYSEIDFESFDITRLHELVIFSHNFVPHLPHALRKLQLAFCNLDDLQYSRIPLPSIEMFAAQMDLTAIQTSNLLKSLPSSLTSLDLSWILLDLSVCPVFPNVVELRLTYPSAKSRQSSLENIQDKFPLLEKLYFTEYGYNQPVSLEPLGYYSTLRSLFVNSKNLVDLGPLSTIKSLKDLDVKECLFIVDFSPVRHVSNIRQRFSD